MCEGRDVNLSIKENYLSLEVQLAPLQKNSQQYLVESNCAAGALIKGVKSPGVEEFRFELPKEVIPDGKHELIQDPTDAYFGIKMQKKSEFTRRAMVTSARSKEKQAQDEADARAKARLANQFLDDEAAYAYCQKFMQEMEEKKKKQLGAEKEDREERSKMRSLTRKYWM